MELQKEITNLQEEYTKIILEIKKLQVQSKIKKENLEEQEYEFNRGNNRLFNINEDIDCNIETNQKKKEKYVSNSLKNLEMITVLLIYLLFNLSLFYYFSTYAKNTNIYIKLSAIITFPFLGGTTSLYIIDRYKNKLKDKFEKAYQESDEFKEYQSKLSEYKQLKEKIEKEHQIKYQIYKSAKDEYNDILNQIKIKKEKLNQIREKLISLVFPNDLFEEVQNLTNEVLFEDNKLDSDELEEHSKIKKKIK